MHDGEFSAGARLVSSLLGTERGARQHDRAGAALAEGRTCVVLPVHREEVRASIAEWQQIIAGCGLDKHMAIVGYLKSEHGMGHGHANALVGWTLAGNVARP